MPTRKSGLVCVVGEDLLRNRGCCGTVINVDNTVRDVSAGIGGRGVSALMLLILSLGLLVLLLMLIVLVSGVIFVVIIAVNTLVCIILL